MTLDWNHHREIIQKLYLIDGNTLKEIMAIMKTEYNFHATKSQYETQFKRWGFRKNLSREEWGIVHERLQEGGNTGRNSQVYLNDILVPNQKIRKGVSRHVFPSQRYVSDPRPPTAVGLSFRTPSPALKAVELKMDDLPWFQFQEVLDVIRLVGLPNDQPQALAESQCTQSSILPHEGDLGKTNSLVVGVGFNQLVANNSARSFWFAPPSPGIPTFGLDGDIHIGDSIFDLHTEQMPLQQDTETPALALSSIFGGLHPDDKTTATTLLLPDLITSILPTLQVKILERHEGELREDFERLIEPCTRDATFHIIKYALYFLSNDMLNSRQIDGFLNWIVNSNHQVMTTLLSLFSVRLPTIEACAHVLFRRAVQTGNVRVTEALLRADIDLSMVLKSSGLPLKEAIEKGNIELVRLLLRAGVDIEQFADDSTDHIEARYPGTLLQAAKTAEMAQLLLEAGADVNALGYHGYRRLKASLQNAVDYDDIELVRTMLKAGANVNVPACDRWGRTALMRAVEKRRYDIVEELLKARAQVDIYGHYIYGDRKSGYRDLTELQLAARLGEYHITELLLSASADANKPAYGEEGSTALQGAAKGGNRKVLRLLLAAGANANTSSNSRAKFPRTALLEAVENGKIGLVKDLLGAGADPNALAFGDYGSNVLEAALAVKDDSSGNLDESSDDGECSDDDDEGSDNGLSMVDVLVKAGADINLSVNNSHRGSELHEAVKRADIKRVQFLVDIGVSIGNVLREAITKDNAGLVDFLLKEGADVNARDEQSSMICGATPLQETILKGNIELAKRLLKAGAYVNAPGYWPNKAAIQIAVKRENVTAVQLLLQAGAEINMPMNDMSSEITTLLQLAASLRNKEAAYQIIQLLLAKGAFVNAPAAYYGGRTALQAAVETAEIGNGWQVVQLLLEAGEDINAPAGYSGGMTALQLAVAGGSLKIVQALLKAGADINAPAGQKSGRTALQLAVENATEAASFKMIDFLLGHKADVNGQPAYEHGRTALQIAANAEGNIDLIQRLLQAGANINAAAGTISGLTALQGAAIRGHTKIVILLLEAGAHVNAPGAKQNGRTALEGASEHGRLDIVKILLNAGADSHLPERRRYTRAAELAEENNHFAISKLLKSYRGM